MIQMGMTASLFTLFTHHAKSTKDLIMTLRNSLVMCGQFRKEELAASQVVQVVRFNVHLKKEKDGRRHIEHITEIEALPEDESGFRLRTLVNWNRDLNCYEVGTGLSAAQLEDMKHILNEEEWGDWMEWYRQSGFL